jgi:phosphate uptake regulator
MKSTDIRKVQKAGKSTITVSLPKDWITSKGLQPGDRVLMHQPSDGTLVITTETDKRKKIAKKMISISENDKEEHIIRKMIGAYLNGYTVLEIKSDKKELMNARRALRKFTQMVVGPEIVEESGNRIILNDLSDPMELPQKKCIKRMHFMVDSMHKDAIRAFLSEDKLIAEDVMDRDRDVDRLYWMVIKQFYMIQTNRSIAEKLGTEPHESAELLIVARVLEKIGDHGERIAKRVFESDISMSEKYLLEISGYHKDALKLLQSAITALLSKDIDASNSVIDAVYEKEKGCELLSKELQHCPEKDTIHKVNVLESVKSLLQYSAEIAEITINLTVREI